MFFREHSDRATLNTFAALAGVSADIRENLGRWGIPRRCSERYLRANLTITMEVHTLVAVHLREGRPPQALGEYFLQSFVLRQRMW